MEFALSSIEKDIVSMLAIKGAAGSEEEKAEVMRFGAEAMTKKLTDAGFIPVLGESDRELFIGTIIDIMSAVSEAVDK